MNLVKILVMRHLSVVTIIKLELIKEDRHKSRRKETKKR